jgi:tetratricopeptide (TPR) repeat protein
VLQSLEEWDSVIERATQALDAAVDPRDRGWLHGVLGNAYQHLGDAEQRWTHYQQAVCEDPAGGEAVGYSK